MAINPNLLIAAPMLQDYLVDKDTGLPLANGIVTLWKDSARFTQYKNWYYQTGVPGNYSFIQLDNPLRLSSSGTIQDPNGNDVIPFYYPYDEDNEAINEAYYITVYSVDSNGNPAILQFTRENFPYNPQGSSNIEIQSTLRNYILNNVYWRNCGSQDLTNVTNIVICPSQHEGFSTNSNDTRFIKDATGANDSLDFLPITQTLSEQAPAPEYWLNMKCTSTGTETVKYISYPIALHVKTLQNQLATVVFSAYNVSGSANNYVTLGIFQYTGAGATSPSTIFPFGSNNGKVTLSTTADTFFITDILPDASTLSLGTGGDDALYLFIQYPPGVVFEINHTKPSLYLGEIVPDNDFYNYDQIAATINSPRTGDYRLSLNSFLMGWVAANDGTIGKTGSSAKTRANNDTWPLYEFIYGAVPDTYAPVSGGRTGSAINDFNNSKTLTLTRTLGRVVAGLNPMLSNAFAFTGSAATDQLTVPANSGWRDGDAVYMYGASLPGNISPYAVYFIVVIDTTHVQLTVTIEDAYAHTNIINITSDGNGTIQSALGAYVGESNHTLTIGEMPSHTHSYTIEISSGLGHDAQSGTGRLNSSSQTGAQGGGGAHNTIQPTVYGNIFFKL